MADLKRVFAQHNTATEQMEWFFMAREGLEGPFESEDAAQAALERYIEYCLFDQNRVFAQRSETSNEIEWFFITRGGFEGPYATEALANKALMNYVQAKIQERSKLG
ncbi:MAG: DUF6316 family protein [Candidatus Methylumidiphilus sp.]